jgi:hypothetical protein
MADGTAPGSGRQPFGVEKGGVVAVHWIAGCPGGQSRKELQSENQSRPVLPLTSQASGGTKARTCEKPERFPAIPPDRIFFEGLPSRCPTPRAMIAPG